MASPAQTLTLLVQATAELQVMKPVMATVWVMDGKVTVPSPKHAAEWVLNTTRTEVKRLFINFRTLHYMTTVLL